VLGRAGQRGQQRRLAAAKDGHATWETPHDIKKIISSIRSAAGEKEKRNESLGEKTTDEVMSEAVMSEAALQNIFVSGEGKD
jgi:hypothetical protein